MATVMAVAPFGFPSFLALLAKKMAAGPRMIGRMKTENKAKMYAAMILPFPVSGLSRGMA